MKWAWHWKSCGTWAGPCNHLDMWVGLTFLHALQLLTVQSTANAHKPGTELGGAGCGWCSKYVRDKWGMSDGPGKHVFAWVGTGHLGGDRGHYYFYEKSYTKQKLCMVITPQVVTVPSEKKKVFNLINNDLINKSWLNDNLPRLMEWSRTMSTKTKGEKIFVDVSLSCLGRAMVASFLSIEPLVVVSLVPRPHLYWSEYSTRLLAHVDQRC